MGHRATDLNDAMKVDDYLLSSRVESSHDCLGVR